MQRFFEDIESIGKYTYSLDCHQNTLECAHCFKKDQFVSHGFVYKQRSRIIKEPVGKRIFCSNRYGRSGCGRTFQLYLNREIPCFQYNATHVFIFITSLLANLTMTESYQKATGKTETRQAWRWVNKFMRKLSDYRTVLSFRSKETAINFSSRSKHLQHLLPTLSRIINNINSCPCRYHQQAQQQSFL